MSETPQDVAQRTQGAFEMTGKFLREHGASLEDTIYHRRTDKSNHSPLVESVDEAQHVARMVVLHPRECQCNPERWIQ